VVALFGANTRTPASSGSSRKTQPAIAGEALSIRQMIDAMVARHFVDPSRVYIVGLSAGGAMTAAMLAAYPERFAAAQSWPVCPTGAPIPWARRWNA